MSAPVLALETISAEYRAKGSQDGRNDSPPRLGDSPSFWVCLLMHLNGLGTIEGVSLENKGDSGKSFLLSGRDAFYPPVFMDQGL